MTQRKSDCDTTIVTQRKSDFDMTTVSQRKSDFDTTIVAQRKSDCDTTTVTQRKSDCDTTTVIQSRILTRPLWPKGSRILTRLLVTQRKSDFDTTVGDPKEVGFWHDCWWPKGSWNWPVSAENCRWLRQGLNCQSMWCAAWIYSLSDWVRPTHWRSDHHSCVTGQPAPCTTNWTQASHLHTAVCVCVSHMHTAMCVCVGCIMYSVCVFDTLCMRACVCVCTCAFMRKRERGRGTKRNSECITCITFNTLSAQATSLVPLHQMTVLYSITYMYTHRLKTESASLFA